MTTPALTHTRPSLPPNIKLNSHKAVKMAGKKNDKGAKDKKEDKGGKAKGAQQINVRHILVRQIPILYAIDPIMLFYLIPQIK